MAYDLAKVTDVGNNLVAGIIANKTSLSIDKIEVSNTQLPLATDITKITSIPNVIQTIQANGFSENGNALIISSILDNSKITADYKAWAFGIWGSDSQNGQSVLMAVVTTTNSPDTIPAYSGSTPVSYTYKFNIGFSDAASVHFDMTSDAFATNDTVVHTTGDETIDGKKAFKTDPVDKNGDAYITGKGIPSNIATLDDVDKKVTDNKNGSIIVNGKTFVPAHDDNVVHATGNENIYATKTFMTPPINFANKKPFITVDDVPKVDTSTWQKQKLTNDDGSPKLAISATQDVNVVIGQAIGKVDAGVMSIDIGAPNNQAGHSLLGTYQVTTTVLNAVLQASDGTLWSFVGTKADSGTTFVWKQVATADDLKSMNLNVLHRDPNTGKTTDAIDFDPGKLTIGGHPVFAIVMCVDEADAKSKSAADPYTLYVYPKES